VARDSIVRTKPVLGTVSIPVPRYDDDQVVLLRVRFFAQLREGLRKLGNREIFIVEPQEARRSTKRRKGVAQGGSAINGEPQPCASAHIDWIGKAICCYSYN
jgi:hypothetical protein